MQYLPKYLFCAYVKHQDQILMKTFAFTQEQAISNLKEDLPKDFSGQIEVQIYHL